MSEAVQRRHVKTLSVTGSGALHEKLTDISPTPSPIFTGVKKCETWPPFAFVAIWFPDGATYRESKRGGGSIFDDRSQYDLEILPIPPQRLPMWVPKVQNLAFDASGFETDQHITYVRQNCRGFQGVLWSPQI